MADAFRLFHEIERAQDWEELLQLVTDNGGYAERMRTLDLLRLDYGPELGMGLYRIVFPLDDQHVIKFALNNEGALCNLLEGEWAQRLGTAVPPVLACGGPQGLWSIVGRATMFRAPNDRYFRARFPRVWRWLADLERGAGPAHDVAFRVDNTGWYDGHPVILDWGNFDSPGEFPDWTMPDAPRVFWYRRPTKVISRPRRLSASGGRLQVAI